MLTLKLTNEIDLGDTLKAHISISDGALYSREEVTCRFIQCSFKVCLRLSKWFHTCCSFTRLTTAQQSDARGEEYCGRSALR